MINKINSFNRETEDKKIVTIKQYFYPSFNAELILHGDVTIKTTKKHNHLYVGENKVFDWGGHIKNIDHLLSTGGIRLCFSFENFARVEIFSKIC